MDKNYDILIDENGDILFDENGEPKMGNAEMQHIQMILESNPGDFKLYPSVGVGMAEYVKSANLSSVKPIIKSQLEADGFRVRDIKIINNTITVEAAR